jgi:hypothetical protein
VSWWICDDPEGEGVKWEDLHKGQLGEKLTERATADLDADLLRDERRGLDELLGGDDLLMLGANARSGATTLSGGTATVSTDGSGGSGSSPSNTEKRFTLVYDFLVGLIVLNYSDIHSSCDLTAYT